MHERTKQASILFRTLMAAFLLLSTILPVTTIAQQGTQATLQITKIDTSEFPLVRVFVQGSGINADLATLSTTVRENGALRPVISNDPEIVGTQVALLLDSARSIANPGSTGDAQYIEAGLAARRLVSESVTRGWLSPDTDWLTSIAFASGTVPKTLKEWNRDHQAVADSIYTFKPQDESLAEATPLFDLLFFTTKAFVDSSPQETQGKARAMVVFSDGFDQVSTTELGDLALASAQPIPIHTVLLGRDVLEQRRNLERISLLTGGTFVHLKNGIEDVDPIWQTIAGTRQQQVITYRSASAQPRDVTVSVKLADGRNVSAAPVTPFVTVQNVKIDVQEPVQGQEIRRVAPEYNTPLGNIEPQELSVLAYFDWPDGFPRELARVEYEVAGAGVVERTEPPFDVPFAFPIGTLDSGTYSLRIRATDELGLVGESRAIPFTVVVTRPPNAAATREAQLVATATSEAIAAARATSEARSASAEATAAAAADAAAAGSESAKLIQLTAEADRLIAQATTEALSAAQQAASEREAVANATATASAVEAQATAQAQQAIIETTQGQVETLSLVSIISSVLAVVALGLAIYVLSNRDRRRKATEIVTGTVKAVTQPFVRTRKGKSVARLVLVDNAGTPGLQATIPLRENSSLRVGRDPELVNVALEDLRVSRLHSRISDDMGGGFRILDEGSTTGTFVNDEEVGIHGEVLKAGDLIGFGPIEYRFEVDESGSSGGMSKTPGTEPYKRTDKKG